MNHVWVILFVAIVATPAFAQRPVLDASAMEAEVHRYGSMALYGITFEPGTATIEAGSEKVLQEIVKLMKDRTDWRFEVQGHTDDRGDTAVHLQQSDARARAVVAWLVQHGIAPSRLVAKGYGGSAPLADNASENGRARNRRVELKKLNDE